MVGAGPSSLAAAFELAKKGYPITVLHLAPEPGAWLRDLPEKTLPSRILTEELHRLEGLGVVFRHVEKLDAALVASITAEAIYLGLDDALAPDLKAMLDKPDPFTFSLARSGWFCAGLAEDAPDRLITDVSQGKEAAISMDRFLQGASLTAGRTALLRGHTELFTNTQGISEQERICPADPGKYSRDEAVLEAGRCLDCQCLECVRHCTYLADYKAYPKVYARRVYNNSAIVKGVHQANRFINSCSLCRQCETLCPKDFSMADLCLDARRQMVRENRMPASAHWFALEEMHSARDEGALIRHAPGTTASRLLFFPGCQLSGIRPQQTKALYDHLLAKEPKTGIWLDCCGVPAHWAGKVEEFASMCENIEKTWGSMGKPQILTACSTCLKILREHVPAVTADSVWKLLASEPVPGAKALPPLALTDPCNARLDRKTQSAVRSLLQTAGQHLTPLPMSGEITECCGFGGLMENAAPATAKGVREARALQSETGFLTYCAMCRDQLAKTGKPVAYLLDILFPAVAVAADTPPARISDRRINRRQLKRELLARYTPSELPPEEPWQQLSMEIPHSVLPLLEERRILEDDIRRVLYKKDKDGKYLVHTVDGVRLASARLGSVTFWVEYTLKDNTYHIRRCWSHRMTIAGGEK
jgi:Fe-S oxidoreductase